MPTYALLGATGSTGSAILRCLQLQPPKDLTLNIFVRSKAKLLRSFPELEKTAAFKIHIIEGVPSDATKLQRCLKDAIVVFSCIATNTSTPDTTIAFDTATAIVKALEFNRQSLGAAYNIPTVLVLRSASLNPNFREDAPWLVHTMVWFCLYYVYSDLERASEFFQSVEAESPGLLKHIYVDPPAIHDPDGTTPTGRKLILTGNLKATLSYADLGVAFCELAERREEFQGKAVGVAATGAVKENWPTLMGYLAQGAKARIFG